LEASARVGQESVFDVLGGGRLIVAANRAPYHRHVVAGSGTPRWERPAGGLTAALDPVMRHTGGIWVAAAAGDDVTLEVPPEDPSYTVRTLGIERARYRHYYLGYANSGLWPLCHHLIERARFRPDDYRAYRNVNRRFAAEIGKMTNATDVIWVHDYHLALLPGELRARGVDLPIALYWHIPWPALAILRMCPERKDLLRGMLGADWIGFQTEDSMEAFAQAVRREIGATWRRGLGGEGRIEYAGRTTFIAAVPISVDMEHVGDLAASHETEARMKATRRRLGIKPEDTTFLGVDRLDYTKGIPERLEAYRHLLEHEPSVLGRVHLIQVAVPSRTEITDYQDLAVKVGGMVEEITHTFSRDGWLPVTLIEHNLRLDQLVALYRIADVAVVSSLFDGQNLVAKEFVAAHIDGDGVLCLSETAGAFHELADAIPLSPLSPEQMAAGLYKAMTLPTAERRRRMALLREAVAKNTIYDWLNRVLRGLAAARAA